MSERRHDSFLPPILRASALLPGPNGNENFVRAAQKKKKKKKSPSYLTVSVSAHTDRQTACHWNQGLQTKALVHKGSLNIFVVLFVALFFDYKTFCCFPRKMRLMNQHQLEINYLKTFVRAHLILGLKLQVVLLGGNTDFWIVLILKHLFLCDFFPFFFKKKTDMYIILLNLSVLVPM